MTAASSAQLITLLSEGNARAILGTAECAWLDFKSPGPKGPYDLSADRGKFELAKDVAAFANAGGGLIVCGFKAVQRPTELHEVAEQATPISKSLINASAYRSVIAEYVRPLVKVDLLSFDVGDSQESLCYFVVEVTALPEEDRWAVVTRNVNEAGHFVKGSWTVPIRNGDSTVYLSADDAYRLINDGQRARRQAPAAGAVSGVEERATARAELRTRLGLDDDPVLFFQSTPGSPTGLLSGMFAASGLRERLANQDTLRNADAFNFAIRGEPEVYEGGLLLASAPRFGLRVEAGGAVTAAAAATSELLCWGMGRYGPGQASRISVFVLTELTLEYFRLVDRFVIDSAAGWRHEIHAVDFTRPPARLLPAGDDPPFPHQGSPQPASQDAWGQGWECMGDPERDAFEALARLYPLFGLDVADNPFTADRRVRADRLIP